MEMDVINIINQNKKKSIIYIYFNLTLYYLQNYNITFININIYLGNTLICMSIYEVYIE